VLAACVSNHGTAAAIAPLLSARSVDTLVLDLDTGAADAAVVAVIVDALRASTTLRSLTIRTSAGYEDDGVARPLVDALRTNVALRSLTLEGGALDWAAGKALCEVLRAETGALTTLRIEGERIRGAFAASRLSDALLASAVLTTVKVAGCSLNFREVKAIAAALPLNATLTSLTLRGGGISDAGALALVTALAANRTLTRLDLLENPAITRRGVAALVDALRPGCELRLSGVPEDSSDSSSEEDSSSEDEE
jgi:hypothetical protein